MAVIESVAVKEISKIFVYILPQLKLQYPFIYTYIISYNKYEIVLIKGLNCIAYNMGQTQRYCRINQSKYRSHLRKNPVALGNDMFYFDIFMGPVFLAL